MSLSMAISAQQARAAKCGCARGQLVHVGQYGVRCHNRGRFVKSTNAAGCASRVQSLGSRKRKKSGGRKKRR